MEWLDKRFRQYVSASETYRLIANQVEAIYDELWNSIGEIIAEARQLRIPLEMNGNPLQHTVRLKEGQQLQIAISKDRCSIVASCPNLPDVGFSLIVDQQSTVRLSQDGAPVNYREAARRIMEPFLFEGKSPFAVHASSAKY